MIRITSTRRLYVCGARLHHGLTGAFLAALGVALMAHDKADWPWPVRDRR